jgi:AbrB family looped-hinge helix DNA binding protein
LQEKSRPPPFSGDRLELADIPDPRLYLEDETKPRDFRFINHPPQRLNWGKVEPLKVRHIVLLGNPMGIKIGRKIGPKGQVVIPREIRTALGLEPGSDVQFDLEDQRIVVTPVMEKDILEMFERDAKESGKRSDKILVGDRLYEKIFGQ